MINIQQLSKKFNSGKPNEVVALERLDLKIDAAEFIVLVGSNGSGKSTLLNLIAGSIFPSTGTIALDGKQIHNLPDYKRSKWMARVFQNPLDGTAAELTIAENFRLTALRGAPKTFQIGLNKNFVQHIKEHISLLGLGLEDKLEQNMGSLSGGQRQALCLLMTVMADIKILLLDEPTAALDPKSATVVLETADRLIKRYNITAVMVTHNLKDAFHYGSRIIQLHNGTLVRDVAGEEKRALDVTTLYSWFG